MLEQTQWMKNLSFGQAERTTCQIAQNNGNYLNTPSCTVEVEPSD